MNAVEQKIIDIVEKQRSKVHHIPVDLTLCNGNITLKAFRIYTFDEAHQTLKGMTLNEEYSYLREDREPVFAVFSLSDIKTIEASGSNYLFLTESIHEEGAISFTASIR